MSSYGREQAEAPTTAPRVFAQAFQVDTGGGPDLEYLITSVIKHLQQFRCHAFERYSQIDI